MRSRIWSALFASAMLVGAAPAADPKSALDKLPANTEYFASVMRLGETVEALGKTRLWKTVWEDKAVQDAWKQFLVKFAADEQFAPLRAILNDPANKDWPALAWDAASNEAFVAVGEGGGDSLALLMELNGFNNFYQGFLEGLKNPNNQEDVVKNRYRAILRSFAAKPERLKAPEMLFGFKISDSDKVAAQLKRLDDILPMLTKGSPLEGRVETTKIGGDEFRVLTLDGGMIPWKEVTDKLEEIEEKPNEFQPLITHIKKQKLSIAIGVRQGYLLVAVGPTTASVTKFGAAGATLAGREEFKPLAKHAGKPLLSVSYSSEKFRTAAAPTADYLTGPIDMAKEGLKKVEGLPEDQRKAIEKDLDLLTKELAKGFKPPKAEMSFSLRTESGWETFTQDYTPTDGVSKAPLTILNQLDGNPLFFGAYRSRTTVEDYQNLVKWLGIIAGHAEKYATTAAPNGEEVVKVYREQALPLFKELNQIIETLWFPALADGQTGFVLDGKWKSKQWHAAMPPAEKELPMLELGLLLGVSDAAKFEKAVEGYRLWINKALAKGRELNPAGAAPEFELKKPPIIKVKDVTLATIAVPEDWGIDAAFVPTAGLSEKFAAFTLSRGHTERLLKSTPLKVASGPLADLSKPLDSVTYINWAGMVDVIAPWLEMAAALAPPQEDGPNWVETLPKVLAAAKAFRSYSSATFRDATGTVTHSEAVFADVTAVKK